MINKILKIVDIFIFLFTYFLL